MACTRILVIRVRPGINTIQANVCVESFLKKIYLNVDQHCTCKCVVCVC